MNTLKYFIMQNYMFTTIIIYVRNKSAKMLNFMFFTKLFPFRSYLLSFEISPHNSLAIPSGLLEAEELL